MAINDACTNGPTQLVGRVAGLCIFHWQWGLLRICHSVDAHISNLIETVDQDLTKPLCSFGTELEMSATFALKVA